MLDLDVRGLTLGYGRSVVVAGASLYIGQGEMVAVLGPNGAGKTTLLGGIMGLLRPRGGQVLIGGEDVTGLAPERLVKRGVVLVPERRELFTALTVEHNLRLGGFTRRSGAGVSLDSVYEMFPVLRERRSQAAGTLSGGEQQMLAIGRAVMAAPKLLMLDEPSIGLAPKVVSSILDVVSHLRDEGLTILLVEQNARLALDISSRGYVLEVGQVVMEGASRTLANDPRLTQAYLGGSGYYDEILAAEFD